MRMSCNGCRVLRKGCSESCSIRPCLQWIKNPESQANATVFLAKFYGRAGLLNLINAGPEHLRPAIFRSLLYEACGRIVNPIYGSVGLLWSGGWQLCQAAVEAVLKGAPIAQLTTELAAGATPPMKAYDIRHVSKERNPSSQELHQVKTRSRFKRSPRKPKAELASEPTTDFTWGGCVPRAPSHDSSLSHQSELNAETESALSVETIEASLASRADLEAEVEPDSRADDELELRLGFVRVAHAGGMRAAENVKVQNEADGCGDATCRVNLGLDLSC